MDGERVAPLSTSGGDAARATEVTNRDEVRRGPPIDGLIQAALWFACTFICILMLYEAGYEGPWYRIESAMRFEAAPPFGHRVLFVLLARALHALLPFFHLPRCYFISQLIAAGIAFWAIRKWAEQFVSPRLAALAPPLLLAMLVPTLTYWTFYDLGMVAAFTLALWALVSRRWNLYLLVFWLATLNHENTLLLVPVSVLLRYGTWRVGVKGLLWAALQLAGYAAIVALLFHFLPARAAWQGGKVAYNLHLLTHPNPSLARPVVLGGVWAAIVLRAWKRLPREIAVALLLAPQLLIITFFFGQLHELRQFDALIPVLVVAVLIAIDKPFTLAPRPAASGV